MPWLGDTKDPIMRVSVYLVLTWAGSDAILLKETMDALGASVKTIIRKRAKTGMEEVASPIYLFVGVL
uniref:BRCT domain-containing protein n=1 Tax=Heterorhabditis bacteriophora TaxID=37862 RepID=A0A1I7XCB5_HETBA